MALALTAQGTSEYLYNKLGSTRVDKNHSEALGIMAKKMLAALADESKTGVT